MKKIICCLFCFALLSGCVYRPDVQQGNIVTPRMLNQIHTGMSQYEVKRVMGDPVLTNTFADNRMNYVYTFQPGWGRMTVERLTLTFKNGRLVQINK